MVSLPDDLLRRLDRAASAAGTSRSAYLARAARNLLAERREEESADAVTLLEKLFSGGSSADAADLVRADRDERDRRDQTRVMGC